MNSFLEELRNRPLLLDGALATELERAGVTFSISPLWSADTLISSPESIYRVHLEYFHAGADVAITASYQASTQGLELHGRLSHHQAIEAIKTSVRLAKRAKEDYLHEVASSQNNPRALFIAGSVGPYGAFLSDGSEYRGDYTLPGGIDGFANWHRPRIRALIDAGADVLALETIPSAIEALGLLKLLKEFPDITAWMSFTVRDEQHISDGSLLVDIARAALKSPQICAVGVNCISLGLADDALRHLSEAIKTEKYFVVYPNSGEKWDAKAKTWSGGTTTSEDWVERVKTWQRMGVRLIGGCCRTGPVDVRAMRLGLNQFDSNIRNSK